jgi:transcription antitermination protein NusB
MAIPNQKLREILFVSLFAHSQGLKEDALLIPLVMEQLQVSKPNVLWSLEKAKHIETKFEELDQKIQQFVIAYEYDRIQTIEKIALRLGAYELLFEPELPPKVAIAEAIRLTKKFGTPAATSFVNAILDALYKQTLGIAINSSELTASLNQLQQSEKAAHEASSAPLTKEE